MSTKALLKTYIKQGKEYKKMLQKVNTNGRHTSKISKIDEKLKKAQCELRSMY
ncbi:hypothetical protein [Candidatus Formimonas warabiya]|uniref:hypothetical protein n=1 Tax=Formimonas warabiya TaxID=1761012 RepID=UPI001BE477C5|nr:hypothetical protein [Candidatus Formimonas warabiya]